MPLGTGYFYDRIKNKYILIDEHATDAVTRPEVFRSHAITHLNPTKDRNEIVIHVLQKGFIRVRHWKDCLGWQFWGDSAKSLAILKRYIKKNDVGEYVTVTFTNFEKGKTVTCLIKDIYEEGFIKSLDG
jgi:hypothetical protein